MKLVRRIVIVSLSGLVVVGVMVWIWLLHTSSGARFIWSEAQARSDGELAATQVEGDLSSGLGFTELRYSSDGLQILVSRLELTVDFDLAPLSLTIESAEISGVDVVIEPEERDTNAPGVQLREVLAVIRLPVKLIVASLRLEDFQYAAGDDRSAWSITSASLEGSLKDILVVDQLLVDAPPGNLSASGSLELLAPNSLRLDAIANVTDNLPAGWEAFDITAAVDGNGDSLNIDLSSTQLQTGIVGTISDLLDAGTPQSPHFDITLSASNPVLPLAAGELPLNITDVIARLSGTPESVAIDAQAKLEIEKFGNIDVSVAGSGMTERLLISELQLQGDVVAATAAGSLDWSPSLAVNMNGKVDRLDPSELVAFWPAGFPVNGAFDANWHGEEIQLNQLELAIASAGAELAATGEIDIPEGMVDGSLRWTAMRWPLHTDVAALTSSDGEIEISGKPADWTVDGRLNLQAANLPAGIAVIQGNGDLDSVAVELTDSNIFGGSVSGEAGFNWRDQKPFSAQMNFSDLRLDWLLSDWPGAVAGSFQLGGRLEPLFVEVDLEEVNGTLRQQPVHGAGGLSISASNVEFRQLSVEHGNSALSIDGSFYSPPGVDFEFVIEDVQSYVENATGHARGNGNLSLAVNSPRIQLNATAEELAYDGIYVESLSAADESATSDLPIDQRVTVSGLRFGDEEIDELTMALVGTLAEHKLAIDLQAEPGSIALGASGALSGFRDAKLATWRGTLTALDIDFPGTFSAGLDVPSSLSVSQRESRLEPICLRSIDSEKLCLELNWKGSRFADANLNLTDVSIDIPLAMANSDIELTQKLTGDIRLGRNSAGLLDGNASVEISPGQVRSRSNEARSTDTDAGAIGFSIENGNLGAGYFDLPIPGIGVIDIDFSIDELDRGADSLFTGRALIDLTDIGVLANILPYVDRTNGRFKTDVEIKGAVSDPVFAGELTLSDASIESEQFGAAFTDINVESTMHADNRLELNGSFRAGDGVGAITSTITYDDIAAKGLMLGISGSNLTLIEMPDLLVVANPDLQIGLSNKALSVDGSLEIPKAMFRPAFNQDLQISESEDVVIVAGELQDQSLAGPTDQQFSINGDLRIDLGSDVQIDLGVARASVTGGVDFKWQEDLLPIASGVYTVDGTIAAVGQVLNISRGTIRFSSVPANNPFLNIRAEREIFGNSQIRTAGVMLTGNAENPVMEAYTNPATNEERALALIATGSDFDYEEGVGAIDFGTYIAPRLFLSYGIGVFDEENVISARYDLKRGFGIKATSGQRESGLDVNYRLEN